MGKSKGEGKVRDKYMWAGDMLRACPIFITVPCPCSCTCTRLSHVRRVEGPRDGSSNGGLVVLVVKALAGVELRPTRGKLDDDGRVVAAGGFEAGVDAGGGDAVHGGDGVA